MRLHLAVLAAGAIVLAANESAAAGPFPAAGPSAGSLAPIELVQAKKEESVTQKVKRTAKRAWRSVAGYTFDVACPTKRATCTETGKDRADARHKCIAANAFCFVSDAN